MRLSFTAWLCAGGSTRYEDHRKGIDMDRSAQLRQSKSLGNLLMVLAAVLGIFLIGGSVGWHYFYGPCGVTRVREANVALSEQMQIYDDAFNIASATSRIALAEPVAELQKIQRAVEVISVPRCMEPAKTKLVL